MDIVPSETLYINNLNEKIKKDLTKKMLNMIFSQYGKVLQIFVFKGIKLRGQAWVVFQDISSATNALRGKQGFEFYGKPMRIQYSKDKSDIIKRKEGTYIARGEKRKREVDASDFESSMQQESSSLIAQNLPPECTEQMLTILFTQCTGFKEVRVAPGNKGIAFFDFEGEVQAGMALRQLNGFQLSASHQLELSYTK